MTHLFKVEDAAWGDIVGCNVPSLEIVYYQDRDLMQPQRSQPPINNNLLPRREGRLEPQKRHRPSHLFRLCSPPHRRTLHPCLSNSTNSSLDAPTTPIVGVLTKPGDTAFTRTCTPTNSAASVCTNECTAALDAECTLIPGMPI